MHLRRDQHRRGYVLVVTLALLVLSATVMVSVARIAIRQTWLARQAQDDLQQRWGVASIRVAVMPFAEQILLTNEASQKRAIPILNTGITLGGQSFGVIIADEQAKANVNALLDRANVGLVETRLRAALVGKAASQLRLRPEALSPPRPRGPATAPTTQPLQAMPISGFGQIFENASPDALLMVKYNSLAPSSLITCWGSGVINLRRASEPALRLMLSPPMSNLDISRLIQSRNALFGGAALAAPAQPISQAQPAGAQPPPAPADPVRKMLFQAGIAPDTASRITLGSSCHSLWIIAQSGGRQWYYFTVLDQSDPKQERTFSMRW